MNQNKPRLTLYTRQYCHLCDDMLAALEVLRGEYDGDFAVDVVNVDADPVLQARYDEFVPVLAARAGGEERELCHYFLDAGVVHRYLLEAELGPLLNRGQVES